LEIGENPLLDIDFIWLSPPVEASRRGWLVRGKETSVMKLDWILTFFFLRFYLFIWQTAREGTQARGGAKGEGEAGSPLSREPRLGAPFQDPGIMT